MKHPASRAFHARWQATKRQAEKPAEARRGIASQLVRHRFAVAGADSAFVLHDLGPAVLTLLGEAAPGRPFPDLFAPESRSAIANLLAIVANETLPAVAGVAARRGRRMVALELTLLPRIGRRHMASAPGLSGLLVSLTPGRPALLGDLSLTSWRHLHPPPAPRILRKVNVAAGVVLYEGARSAPR